MSRSELEHDFRRVIVFSIPGIVLAIPYQDLGHRVSVMVH